MRTSLLFALLALSTLPACSGKDDDLPEPPEETTTDSGTTDPGTTDTGPTGNTDSGATDSGTTDTSTTDTNTGATDTQVTDTEPPAYHPDGYLDPAQHGHDAKFQEDTCTECHGADLTGDGAALSCDTCHTPEDPQAWRTDCTFCHGGEDNETGAPPVDIDNDPKSSSFAAHTAHVTDSDLRVALDCTQCHTMPEDVLTPGHFMVGDKTPGLAELDFAAGIAAGTAYEGLGSCATVYCHGNGQGDNGAWSEADGAPVCGDCHPTMDDTRSDWNTMSGEHAEHVGHNLGCHECHNDTVERTDDAIEDPSLHINGEVDFGFDGTIVWDSSFRTCSGSCHNETHDGRRWD